VAIKFPAGIPLVPISDFVEYELNPKLHPPEQIDRLASGMLEYGFLNPVIADSTGQLVAGHGRLLAARILGLTELPCIKIDHLSESQKKAFVIFDNKISETGWDDEKVAQIMKELDTENYYLEQTGFNDKEIETLMDDFDTGDRRDGERTSRVAPRDGVDNAPAKPKNIISKTGDLWALGGLHHLLCGDSTNAENVAAVFGDKKADMILTDPPYGVNYSAKNEMLNAIDRGNHIQKPIENDKGIDYKQFFMDFLKPVPLKDYNTCYIFMSNVELHNLRTAFDASGFYWSSYLCWCKNHFVLGRKDYNHKHEFVLYGWKGKHKFYGESNSSTVLNYSRPAKSDLHPTMKPVDLLMHLITDGSPRKGVVYDPFGGSGSTLIACEETGRNCLTIEKDPAYVDVIVRRYRELTGKTARLLNREEPVSV